MTGREGSLRLLIYTTTATDKLISRLTVFMQGSVGIAFQRGAGVNATAIGVTLTMLP